MRNRAIDVHAVLADPNTWSLSPPRRQMPRRISELRARSLAVQRFEHMREMNRANEGIIAADERLRELTPFTLAWCEARLRRHEARPAREGRAASPSPSALCSHRITLAAGAPPSAAIVENRHQSNPLFDPDLEPR